jgi:nucleotide-binding universal stress UspA family protein
MNTKTILIPLDGSEMAEAALAEARQLSRPDSALVLMRAASAHALPGTDVLDAQFCAAQEAEVYLETLKAHLEEQGVRGVEAHVWYGPAAAAIVDAARLYGADLIVMSTHGRSGLGRLVFGSVAESVLRGTTVPILLVRPSNAPIAAVPGRERATPAAPLRKEVAR